MTFFKFREGFLLGSLHIWQEKIDPAERKRGLLFIQRHHMKKSIKERLLIF